MANSYEAPIEVRELEKLINNFTYQNGFDVSQVFNDFLTYIIHYFTPDAKPLESWKYKLLFSGTCFESGLKLWKSN